MSVAVRVAQTSKSSIKSLITLMNKSCTCPAHSQARALQNQQQTHAKHTHGVAKDDMEHEYAFEMSASSMRFGRGVTAEVGMDLVNMKAQKVMVMTDPNIAKLPVMKIVIDSLTSSNVPFVVYDRTRAEPTDASFNDAIEFAKAHKPDVFVAVGGGSVMDTCKAANLYSHYPEADLLEFVNAPIGKGSVIHKTLSPLICIPTTAGTGSETTGTSIFDYKPLGVKTGIASRKLRPTLGLIDPNNTRTMPSQVKIASGLDVLCHALESYTALPYQERTPRPANPAERPAYQGSNPISDIWSLEALRMTVKYLGRSAKDPLDEEANEQMALAASAAGTGFGSAGVHLCHGMSYPISGLNKSYKHPEYNVDHKIVPHGISVAVTAPAVFRYTGEACPDRHFKAAEIFGADMSKIRSAESAGPLLSEQLSKFLEGLGVPSGLEALGYTKADIPALVKGTLPQHRVTKLAPLTTGAEALEKIFEGAMKNY
ncbi:Hydroxyacid-oxoacid transhydrogenase, mitochondrial [Dissophora globulifera]|uniref:Hydroxyacid-oxoacid transhydrogenase, mitochondrial n=1 Tax=Dissophora globulifera TaxID=979702 RepID=A0A9P6RQI8_9FUNG|nr:Hydroxyacid-oxoacid transhydrogenase, mitochondrial [Dissophora globulifera]KAG0323859.1 Hydroxyacid-oxoacid transhydrogenase, mitochondrial [Dissophora globulifera]